VAVIGFEMEEYSVSESDGVVRVCVSLVRVFVLHIVVKSERYTYVGQW